MDQFMLMRSEKNTAVTKSYFVDIDGVVLSGMFVCVINDVDLLEVIKKFVGKLRAEWASVQGYFSLLKRYCLFNTLVN